MKIFKRKPIEQNQEQKTSTGDGILFRTIVKVKQQLAAWLGRKSEKFSPQGKKISLLLFGVLMGGVSLMLIINSLRGASVNASIFPQAIESPVKLPGHESASILTADEYKRLTEFKQMMDSLKQTPEGRIIHEEILKGRKGLIDSIDFILSIY